MSARNRWEEQELILVTEDKFIRASMDKTKWLIVVVPNLWLY